MDANERFKLRHGDAVAAVCVLEAQIEGLRAEIAELRAQIPGFAERLAAADGEVAQIEETLEPVLSEAWARRGAADR
jgi:prefoldin subunit 5